MNPSASKTVGPGQPSLGEPDATGILLKKACCEVAERFCRVAKVVPVDLSQKIEPQVSLRMSVARVISETLYTAISSKSLWIQQPSADGTGEYLNPLKEPRMLEHRLQVLEMVSAEMDAQTSVQIRDSFKLQTLNQNIRTLAEMYVSEYDELFGESLVQLMCLDQGVANPGDSMFYDDSESIILASEDLIFSDSENIVDLGLDESDPTDLANTHALLKSRSNHLEGASVVRGPENQGPRAGYPVLATELVQEVLNPDVKTTSGVPQNAAGQETQAAGSTFTEEDEEFFLPEDLSAFGEVSENVLADSLDFEVQSGDHEDRYAKLDPEKDQELMIHWDHERFIRERMLAKINQGLQNGHFEQTQEGTPEHIENSSELQSPESKPNNDSFGSHSGDAGHSETLAGESVPTLASLMGGQALPSESNTDDGKPNPFARRRQNDDQVQKANQNNPVQPQASSECEQSGAPASEDHLASEVDAQARISFVEAKGLVQARQAVLKASGFLEAMSPEQTKEEKAQQASLLEAMDPTALPLDSFYPPGFDQPLVVSSKRASSSVGSLPKIQSLPGSTEVSLNLEQLVKDVRSRVTSMPAKSSLIAGNESQNQALGRQKPGLTLLDELTSMNEPINQSMKG